MEKNEIRPLVTELTRYDIDITHQYDDCESGWGDLETTPDPEGEWMKAEEVIADRRLSEKRIEELEEALRLVERELDHDACICFSNSAFHTTECFKYQKVIKPLLSTPK